MMTGNTTWMLPTSLLRESVRVMQPHGANGNEGLALWYGNSTNGVVTVSHIVEVYGTGFETSPLYMSLSRRAMSVLTDLVDHLDAALVGQIHSHPGQLLDLSDLDRAHGIRVPNYLSVVCPYYAQRLPDSYQECGVHVFEQSSYCRLTRQEIAERIVETSRALKIVKVEVPA